MNRSLLAISCSFVFAITGMAGLAQAQTAGKAAAQAHINKAKAVAYEPGQDLIDVFENICGPAISERGPQIPGLQVAATVAAFPHQFNEAHLRRAGRIVIHNNDFGRSTWTWLNSTRGSHAERLAG